MNKNGQLFEEIDPQNKISWEATNLGRAWMKSLSRSSEGQVLLQVAPTPRKIVPTIEGACLGHPAVLMYSCFTSYLFLFEELLALENKKGKLGIGRCTSLSYLSVLRAML
jgi:hypothetical protein